MCFVRFADVSGSIEAVVFPTVFQTSPACWRIDTALVVAGRMSDRDGERKLVIEKAEELTSTTVAETVSRWQRLRYTRRQPLAAPAIDDMLEAE